MKKICLFSTKSSTAVEGDKVELHVNFYLVLNKNYIFTFLIDSPDLSCSGRNPIKLWKRFLIILEETNTKYLRRWERYERLYYVLMDKPKAESGNGDLISRQAVLELVADYDLSMGQVVKGIHALPPVTQQPCEEREQGKCPFYAI